MGCRGYLCGFGSIILFAGLVVLAFAVTPSSDQKLDPECYIKCEYGVSEYRKNVKQYCRLAAALGITVGITLSVIEYVAWVCGRGGCVRDRNSNSRTYDQSLVSRTVRESSYYYYTTPGGNQILVTRRHDNESARRGSTDSNDSTASHNGDRYYDDSTAPLDDEVSSDVIGSRNGSEYEWSSNG